MVGKLYQWNLWHFHIKAVRCGKAPAFPHQKPGSVQFVQCGFYGGAIFSRKRGYRKNGGMMVSAVMYSVMVLTSLCLLVFPCRAARVLPQSAKN